MPTTRKQKKARKSRGLEILSDIENLDIMLGENHFNETERDESLDSASVRRHDSVTSKNLENEGGSSYSNHMNSIVRANTVNGQNSADVSSQTECGTCGKKNHPEERCWQVAGAHLKPKRTRSEDSNDNKLNSKAQKPPIQPTSSNSQSSSSNDESKN